MLYLSLLLSLFPWVPYSSSTVTDMFYIWASESFYRGLHSATHCLAPRPSFEISADASIISQLSHSASLQNQYNLADTKICYQFEWYPASFHHGCSGLWVPGNTSLDDFVHPRHPETLFSKQSLSMS
jgi:hypothetical protein